MEENKAKIKIFMNGRSQAIRFPKQPKTWLEITKEMPAFPDFNINRIMIGRKPRKISL